MSGIYVFVEKVLRIGSTGSLLPIRRQKWQGHGIGDIQAYAQALLGYPQRICSAFVISVLTGHLGTRKYRIEQGFSYLKAEVIGAGHVLK